MFLYPFGVYLLAKKIKHVTIYTRRAFIVKPFLKRFVRSFANLVVRTTIDCYNNKFAFCIPFLQSEKQPLIKKKEKKMTESKKYLKIYQPLCVNLTALAMNIQPWI